jgi:hypothetical protein
METAPKTTVTVTILLCGALTAGVILFMDPIYSSRGQKVTVLEPTQVTSLAKLWADDPEAAQAELVAKAFLNATSARAARSFVFESESLGESFDRLYKPISSPDNYELELTSRVRAPDGEGSIFAYRVTTSDQLTRMMVVVPEGKMPKVYWQFFAEVGDMSWGEFMETRPGEATRMLAWVEEGTEYFSPYSEDRWTSYILHDYEDSYTLRAFVERSTGPDWKLANALEKDPRKFGRRVAVMAQVDLAFMSEMKTADDETFYVVEIKGVEATDWLPARFRARQGPTMEASEVEPTPEAGE